MNKQFSTQAERREKGRRTDRQIVTQIRRDKRDHIR